MSLPEQTAPDRKEKGFMNDYLLMLMCFLIDLYFFFYHNSYNILALSRFTCRAGSHCSS